MSAQGSKGAVLQEQHLWLVSEDGQPLYDVKDKTGGLEGGEPHPYLPCPTPAWVEPDEPAV